MNFQELLQKIATLDQQMVESVGVGECDAMSMSGPSEPPKQQDSVTMNVSMNGSGSGGIRELLNVLNDLQDTSGDADQEIDMDFDNHADDAGDDVLLKKNIDSMDDMVDDSFANSIEGGSGPTIAPISAVTQSGDDLHKSKGSYPKASGGDNAMKLKDGAVYKLPTSDIKVKLEALYKDISSPVLSELSKDTLSKYRDKASDDETTRHRKRWSTELSPRDISTPDEKRKIANRRAGLARVKDRIGSKPQPARDFEKEKQDSRNIQKTYYSGNSGRNTGD